MRVNEAMANHVQPGSVPVVVEHLSEITFAAISSVARDHCTEPHRLILLCQGACGLGGQDWDGPHRLVGRLLLGHTVRVESLLGGWGGRQVILRTASGGASAGLLGQTPPPGLGDSSSG